MQKENFRKRIEREIESIHYGFRIIKKDREIRNVEVYSSNTEYKGRPAIIGTIVDVTERKLAEEALQKSKEKYQSIFENIQDVYLETLIDGTILEISPSIVTLSNGQYCREDLLGKSMCDFDPDAQKRKSLHSILQQQKNVAEFEMIFENRDGSLIPCSVFAKLFA